MNYALFFCATHCPAFSSGNALNGSSFCEISNSWFLLFLTSSWGFFLFLILSFSPDFWSAVGFADWAADFFVLFGHICFFNTNVPLQSLNFFLASLLLLLHYGAGAEISSEDVLATVQRMLLFSSRNGQCVRLCREFLTSEEADGNVSNFLWNLTCLQGRYKTLSEYRKIWKNT